MAPEKADAILLSRKGCASVSLKLKGHEIEASKSCRYLGAFLGEDLTGSVHLCNVAAKANRVVSQLGRIMLRFKGASEAKRRLIGSAAESIVTYAGTSRAKAALLFKKTRTHLRIAQRPPAIRIARAYRMMSFKKALVLARTLPWNPKLREILDLEADP